MTGTLSGVSPDTLADLLQQVWSSYLSGDLDVVAEQAVFAEPVTASVSITGASNGHVVLRLDRPAAVDVACTMLHLDEAELATGDVADVIGEIANMVGGNVKTVLPEPSSLSLPQVTFGAEDLLLPGAGLAAEATLRWRAHVLQVTLWRQAAGSARG